MYFSITEVSMCTWRFVRFHEKLHDVGKKNVLMSTSPKVRFSACAWF